MDSTEIDTDIFLPTQIDVMVLGFLVMKYYLNTAYLRPNEDTFVSLMRN